MPCLLGPQLAAEDVGHLPDLVPALPLPAPSLAATRHRQQPFTVTGGQGTGHPGQRAAPEGLGWCWARSPGPGSQTSSAPGGSTQHPGA